MWIRGPRYSNVDIISICIIFEAMEPDIDYRSNDSQSWLHLGYYTWYQPRTYSRVSDLIDPWYRLKATGSDGKEEIWKLSSETFQYRETKKCSGKRNDAIVTSEERKSNLNYVYLAMNKVFLGGASSSGSEQAVRELLGSLHSSQRDKE